ncbi:MAG: response regulator transcription factor [Flammeovirgaceae bacterium]|nr:response regulator transcription factor [Flammeovirgaceae bacterium]
MGIIKVLLADGQILVRNGIKSLLKEEKDIYIVGEASNGDEALEKVKALQPDVLVLAIELSNPNGIEVAKKVREYSDQTKPLILTTFKSEDYVMQSIESGAEGYLLKDANEGELIEAIKRVYDGQKYFSSIVSGILVNNYLKIRHPKEAKAIKEFDLTKRELEVLQLIANGMSSREISAQINTSIRTVQVHRFNIMKKLNVKNVVELINIAFSNNLIEQLA